MVHRTAHHHTTTTTTTRPRRGIFGARRTRARAAPRTTAHTAAPVHHQRRKPTMKDKISGALKKLKGTIRGHPGEKAAGTRRMHGTDGRGSHRRGYY